MDGVWIFQAEKWVDSVVSVERHSKRVMVFRMVLDKGNWRRKKSFWNEVFHLVSCIPQNEKVLLAGDMNGHAGSSNAGCDGMHGGFGYGSRNADGSRILEFADGLNLVICNTLFMKQEYQLVTCAAGPV